MSGTAARGLLLLLVESRAGLTTDQVATELGSTWTNAHQRLRRLEGDGLLTRSISATSPPCGGRRPSMWTVTERGRSLTATGEGEDMTRLLGLHRRDRGTLSILQALTTAPMTVRELTTATGFIQQSVRAMTGALVTAGQIERTGKKREAPRGILSAVYTLTEIGRERLSLFCAVDLGVERDEMVTTRLLRFLADRPSSISQIAARERGSPHRMYERTWRHMSLLEHDDLIFALGRRRERRGGNKATVYALTDRGFARVLEAERTG